MARSARQPTVCTQDPNTMTLTQARDWHFAESKLGVGALCPCCAKKNRIYGRKIAAAEAAVLLLLHRTYPVGALVHIQNFVVSLKNSDLMRGRQWSRLTHWGLLDNTSNKGVYQLTDGGYGFVFKGHLVNERALVQDNECIGFDGKLLNLSQVLRKDFDLNDLLNYQLPQVTP